MNVTIVFCDKLYLYFSYITYHILLRTLIKNIAYIAYKHLRHFSFLTFLLQCETKENEAKVGVHYQTDPVFIMIQLSMMGVSNTAILLVHMCPM